jgi:hypothetical protein
MAVAAIIASTTPHDGSRRRDGSVLDMTADDEHLKSIDRLRLAVPRRIEVICPKQGALPPWTSNKTNLQQPINLLRN